MASGIWKPNRILNFDRRVESSMKACEITTAPSIDILDGEFVPRGVANREDVNFACVIEHPE
jgi:hypothetical protein